MRPATLTTTPSRHPVSLSLNTSATAVLGGVLSPMLLKQICRGCSVEVDKWMISNFQSLETA